MRVLLSGFIFHRLKIKHFCFRSQIDEMRATGQNHVGEKLGLVNLTSLCAGDSNPDRDFVFHKIGKIITGTVSGFGFFLKISCGIRPHDTIVDEKQIYLVPF
jgi:hypothetical protein